MAWCVRDSGGHVHQTLAAYERELESCEKHQLNGYVGWLDGMGKEREGLGYDFDKEEKE